MQLLYHPASTLSTPHRHALGYSHPPRLPMSSEDFRRLRTGHVSCGRLNRVRVRTLFTVPIVAVTACISITKNEKSYAIKKRLGHRRILAGDISGTLHQVFLGVPFEHKAQAHCGLPGI